MNKHFATLDLYRYVAALGVFLFHFAHDKNGLTEPRIAHFYLFVDFFFILSGFVIGRSYWTSVQSTKDVGVFLRRRIARLYPLHILTLMIFVAMAVGFSAMHLPVPPDRFDYSILPAEFTLTHAWTLGNAAQWFNYPSWSISVEWAMYLLFPLLMLAFRKIGTSGLVLIALIGFALHEMTAPDPGMGQHWERSFSPLRALPTFTCGLIIVRITNQLHLKRGLAIGALCFTGAVFLMLAHANIYLIVALLGATVLMTAAGELASASPIDRPIFRALGNCSYSVYMLHAALIAGFNFVWLRAMPNMAIPLAYAIPGAVLLTGLSLICFRYFERPTRELLSGHMSRSSVARAAQ